MAYSLKALGDAIETGWNTGQAAPILKKYKNGEIERQEHDGGKLTSTKILFTHLNNTFGGYASDVMQSVRHSLRSTQVDPNNNTLHRATSFERVTRGTLGFMMALIPHVFANSTTAIQDIALLNEKRKQRRNSCS